MRPVTGRGWVAHLLVGIVGIGAVGMVARLIVGLLPVFYCAAHFNGWSADGKSAK